MTPLVAAVEMILSNTTGVSVNIHGLNDNFTSPRCLGEQSEPLKEDHSVQSKSSHPGVRGQILSSQRYLARSEMFLVVTTWGYRMLLAPTG